MTEFMKILLALSVSGSLLFLLILGLKLLYKNRFSKCWQYYIWMIVVLRFLLPFAPTDINFGSLFEQLRTAVTTSESLASPDIPIKVNVKVDLTKPVQEQTVENITAPTAAYDLPDVSAALFWVWLAIALILFVRKLTMYQGFIRYIKAGNTEVADIKTLNLLSDCEEKLNISTRVELCHNTLIASPIMIGFFRPSIILPAQELGDKELSYIFLHELLHCRQRDMFYKWLIQIVACIHWFNPFVYLLEKEVNKACELSCDEMVISVLDDKSRREYGDALIYFMKPNTHYKNNLASVTLTEGAKQLKERLGAIMNYKKKGKAIRFLTGVLTLCMILGAAFTDVYPVAAANHSGTAKTIQSSTSKMKNCKNGTYIYDEGLGYGWYLDDDDDWDWDDDDWDWDDDDWDWDDDDDWDWDWDDKALIEAYAACGIEKKGKSFYYQGELVYFIKDQRPDSSFFMLDTNSKGKVSIKVIRNTKGEITGVSYMTEDEIAELLERAVGETEEIPVINTRKWDSSALLKIEAYYETDNIYILPSPTNEVILIEYLTADKASYHASAEIKNNTLTIRAGKRPTTNYKSFIEIYVPNNVLDKVKVETVSGAITVDSYSGAVALSTTSGVINIFDCMIAGKVSTVSGSIGLYPSNVSGDLYVGSHSGKISAIFPTSISYKIKAETTNGKIKSSLFDIKSKNNKKFSKTVGSNPKYTITLKTFTANIEIN